MREQETLFAEERKLRIMDLILKKEKVTVNELVDHFKVSSATIRNDLREMGNQNMLVRTHGGAILRTSTGFEPDASHKEGQNVELKREIAEAALALVDNGDTIVLDTGTTTLELARMLGTRKNVICVTNDIHIASALEDCEGVSILVLGGNLRKKHHCTSGPYAKTILADLTVDKAFMGVNSLNVKRGATTPDVNMAEMKKAMLSIATKKYFLCDSTKLGRSSFVQFAAIEEVDTVITDRDADPGYVKELEGCGVEVIIAK
jgi:DeoR family transcriptional regulator, fructose operon transcriptional repressor